MLSRGVSINDYQRSGFADFISSFKLNKKIIEKCREQQARKMKASNTRSNEVEWNMNSLLPIFRRHEEEQNIMHIYEDIERKRGEG